MNIKKIKKEFFFIEKLLLFKGSFFLFDLRLYRVFSR